MFIFSFFKKNLLLINYFCSWWMLVFFILIMVYSIFYDNKKTIMNSNLYFAIVFASLNIFFHIYNSNYVICNKFTWAIPNVFNVKYILLNNRNDLFKYLRNLGGS